MSGTTSIVELLKHKDQGALIDLFQKQLSTTHTDVEIAAKGVTLYTPYMNLALELVKLTPLSIVGNNLGVRYYNGEFSDVYKLVPELDVRIPIEYTLSINGISCNGSLFYKTPIYPVSVLYIANGAYPCYYRIKNMISDTAFVTTLEDIDMRRYKDMLKGYIVNTVIYSSLEPKKIDVTTYS